MPTNNVERIAALASLLDDELQETLWEYAELLYVQQVAFEHTDPLMVPAELDPRVWTKDCELR